MTNDMTDTDTNDVNKPDTKGSVNLADIRADARWWSSEYLLSEYHDQKEISLGLLLVQRISARMSASVNEP
jgi:hypothetical protein